MNMKSLKRRCLVFALLCLAVVVLVSCGGGGSSSGGDGASGYTVSGTLTSAGIALQGVTISLISSSGTTTTVTAADGTYSFSGLANGKYTVVPSLAGHTFQPVSTAISVSGANVTGKNVTATASSAPAYNITGKVSGAVVNNVMITLNGDATGSVFTDANGNYSFPGLAAGSYTVTPSLAGYSFGPAAPITISTGNSTLNNFVSAVAQSGSNLLFAPALSLPDATVGKTYSNSIIATISGGSSPYHYQSDSFATGAPPIGMMVDLNGNLTGTPKVAGTYTFGVCAVDIAGASSCGTTKVTVSPVSLTGTWVGTWSWSGTGSNGCSFSDGGSFTMVLTQFGTSFSGSTSGTGIQTRNDSTCALMSTDAGSGSASGTISGTTANLSFTLVDIATLSFTGTATFNVDTLTASFVRSTGGSGSFTLTRQ
jgi:hypothetical protein